MITRGSTYTQKNSDIKVLILDIEEETKTYYKCRCAIFHRRINTWYELNGKYTLFKDRISNWEKLDE